jgi:hypothetical protein
VIKNLDLYLIIVLNVVCGLITSAASPPLPAGNVGIADMLRWTLADGGSPVVLTDCAGSAWRTGARIELAVGVGVAGVTRTTFTDSRPAHRKLNQSRENPQGADSPPLPQGAAKAGRNHWNK